MVCIFVLASYSVIKTSGAHPGSTGAPKDQTCAQHGCHSAQVVQNPVGINTLTFSSPDSTYVAGQIYTITIQVQKPLVDKFGFEVQAIKDADSTDIGSWIITDVARTHMLNHVVPPGLNRNSVTHNAAGTVTTAPNTNQWTMNWQAPPSNEGNITFYYATNCTNNNGLSTGDMIYLSSFTIKPKITSVKELSDVHELKLYYDAETKELNINYDVKGNKKIGLKVFDCVGKMIYEMPVVNLSGKQKQTVALGNEHKAGTYLVQLGINDQQTSRKVVVY
jgi:hypothetical protein